jgi:hypothetical protein
MKEPDIEIFATALKVHIGPDIGTLRGMLPKSMRRWVAGNRKVVFTGGQGTLGQKN